MNLVPTHVFPAAGVGRSKYELLAFEEALRNAHVEKYNHVLVSSIFPPHCKLLHPSYGLDMLQAGSIAFSAFAKKSSMQQGQRIAAACGVAIPKDPTKYGYLSEYDSYNETESEAGRHALDLSAYMLARNFNIPYTIGLKEDAHIQQLKRCEQYFTAAYTSASAIVEGVDEFTCVYAGYVFCGLKSA